MTTRDGFTRLVDTWLAEEGVQTMPDYLDEVLDRTSTSRQRPAWLSPGRWLPVDTTTINPRAYSIPPIVRYGVLAALLIVAVVAAIALYAGSQRNRVPAPFGPAANGQIYFDVDGAIVTTNADGTGRRTIDVGATASAPYMSPDGTKFVFVTIDPTTVAGGSVFVADADGSRPRKISADLRLDINPLFNPTWSPDSSQVVFGSYHQGFDELFLANADGSGVRALGVREAMSRSNPEWAPSGDWIAYEGWDPTKFDEEFIAVIRPDGTGERRLPTGPGAGEGFRGFQLWAPDATNRLAYALGAAGDAEGYAIAVMDVDTGVETIVSDEPGKDEHRPAWSPDGTRVAFHLGDRIAVANPDGSGRIVLEDALADGPFGWSPDGAWLYGKSPDNLGITAIDASGEQPPILIKLEGAEAGVFSWQRTAP